MPSAKRWRSSGEGGSERRPSSIIVEIGGARPLMQHGLHFMREFGIGGIHRSRRPDQPMRRRRAQEHRARSLAPALNEVLNHAAAKRVTDNHGRPVYFAQRPRDVVGEV